MLLSAAKVNRSRLFIGQDIDLRCVRMTAINLALRNLYGYVLWGNALTLEQKLAYKTGFNGRGVIREITPPAPTSLQHEAPRPDTPAECDDTPAPPAAETVTQRNLFELE